MKAYYQKFIDIQEIENDVVEAAIETALIMARIDADVLRGILTTEEARLIKERIME